MTSTLAPSGFDDALRGGGTVLAEVEPPGSGVRYGSARLVHRTARDRRFRGAGWARTQ